MYSAAHRQFKDMNGPIAVIKHHSYDVSNGSHHFPQDTNTKYDNFYEADLQMMNCCCGKDTRPTTCPN
jgi:hypothetical protein